MDISGLQILCCNTDDLRSQLQSALHSMVAENDWAPRYDHIVFTDSIDPESNFMALLDGKVVSVVSACNYGDEFCFIGTFVTAKGFQGQGIGKKLFEECLKHAGNRLIGIYSAESMIEWYTRYGFTQISAHVGSVLRMPNLRNPIQTKNNDNLQIVPVKDVSFDDLCRFDRKYFPADRKEFLKVWLSHPHVACSYVCLRDNKIAGYGMIRSYAGDKVGKIGPLFADSLDVAEKIAVALLNEVPEGIQLVRCERMDANKQSGVLTERLGFTNEDFGGTIMFKNGTPDFDINGVYSYTSSAYG